MTQFPTPLADNSFLDPDKMLPGYDPVGHNTNVVVRVVNVTTDTAISPPITYGDLAISGTLGPASAANSLPVIDAAQQGWLAATGSGTAGTDNTLTFVAQVRKVALYNRSAQSVPLEFDEVSTVTSWPLLAGQTMIVDGILCTTIHVFPSATLPINTTAGLYVKGWK